MLSDVLPGLQLKVQKGAVFPWVLCLTCVIHVHISDTLGQSSQMTLEACVMLINASDCHGWWDAYLRNRHLHLDALGYELGLTFQTPAGFKLSIGARFLCWVIKAALWKHSSGIFGTCSIWGLKIKISIMWQSPKLKTNRAVVSRIKFLSVNFTYNLN